MGKGRRKRVGEFEVGQVVKYKRKPVTIATFPSRRLAMIRNGEGNPGGWVEQTVSILQIEKFDENKTD